MQVRCPQCGAEVDWQRSPARPFCSERCRLIDLSAWIEERYAIPGEPFEDTPNSAPEALRNDDESGRD